MIDPFLLLTPILMFFVVALLAFVGCQYFYGVALPPDPPTNLQGIPGDNQATLSWTASAQAISYNLKRGMASGGPFQTIANVAVTTFVDSTVTDGTTYYYVVSATDDNQRESDNSSPSVPVTPQAPPPMVPFVTGYTAGTPQTNFTGFAGMAILVGPSPLNVFALGRLVVPMNTGLHGVKIVDAGSGVDVPGGAAVVDTAGGTAGTFAYANLQSPVVLNANAAYYIVSQETSVGDNFYHDDTTVDTTNVASVTSAVYIGGPVTTYTLDQSAGHSYGPVNFIYTV